MLAFDRRSEPDRAARIVGSHLVGGIDGVATWSLIAADVSLAATPPTFSTEGFRLTASATVPLVVTSWGMTAVDAVQARACATTLIVSLGLLSTPIEVAIIVASVVVLVGFHASLSGRSSASSAAHIPCTDLRGTKTPETAIRLGIYK